MLESSACFLLPSFYDIVYCLKLHIDCTRTHSIIHIVINLANISITCSCF